MRYLALSKSDRWRLDPRILSVLWFESLVLCYLWQRIETQFIHKENLVTLTKTSCPNYSTLRTFAYLLENKTFLTFTPQPFSGAQPQIGVPRETVGNVPHLQPHTRYRESCFSVERNQLPFVSANQQWNLKCLKVSYCFTEKFNLLLPCPSPSCISTSRYDVQNYWSDISIWKVKYV
jgi:hypothetical protein